MAALRNTLSEIGPEGLSLTVDDPAVWNVPLAEFQMACRVVRPLRAELFVLPQENGCLLRGRISGEVALPCNRCAVGARVGGILAGPSGQAFVLVGLPGGVSRLW